jgi:hypothetical protein
MRQAGAVTSDDEERGRQESERFNKEKSLPVLRCWKRARAKGRTASGAQDAAVTEGRAAK